MELQGKIIVVLPERSGTSQRGNQWRSISYVLETQDQYPKKLAFDVTNDKIDQLNIQLGEILPFSSILMLENIMEDGLTRLTLGTLSVRLSNLLHKVAVLVAMFSLAHKQRNKLWQVLLMLLAWQTRRISKIFFHLNSSQHSRQHSHKVIVRICHFEVRRKVEMIKQAFNAVEI